MKKFLAVVCLALLAFTGKANAQGTQINGNQIKDDTITGAKIKSNANILWSKIDFTGFTLSTIGAESPLTFNSPLTRATNTISLGTVPLTSGGLGITSVPAGRVPFGLNSSQLTTDSKLAFDSANGRLTINNPAAGSFKLDVSGAGRFSSNLSINGVDYTWPASIAAGAGYLLTDPAGDGVLTWAAPPLTGVTLQGSDPGTPDTGGINVSASVYALRLGLEGQTTRPSSSWTGGALPAAAFWNVASVGADQAGVGPSQSALSWTDSTQGYLGYFYTSNNGANGNGIFVASASSDPSAKLFTGNSVGSDKFILFSNGAMRISPDNGGLPPATTGSSPAFINVGSIVGDATTHFMLHFNATTATGFTAADNWIGLDSEFAFTGSTALTSMRGAILRASTAGDLDTGRGLFTGMGLTGAAGTQTAVEVNGARINASLAGAGTHTVTDISGVKSEVSIEGGTNNVTNSYGLYVDNQFTGGTTATVTNAYGMKLFNTFDASAAVTTLYGMYYMHPTAGTVTNEKAIYLEAVGSGSGDYAIYSAGGKSYFAGQVEVGSFKNLKLETATPVNAKAATATLTSTGVAPSDGDQVKIGATTYTFKTALTPTTHEVLINGTAAAALINLDAAINYTGTPGTDYVEAAANTEVSSGNVLATSIDLTAKTKGVIGNSLDSTTPTGVTLSFSGVTFGTGGGTTAGVDGTVASAGQVYYDASYLYVCSATCTISTTNWRRITLGSAY